MILLVLEETELASESELLSFLTVQEHELHSPYPQPGQPESQDNRKS